MATQIGSFKQKTCGQRIVDILKKREKEKQRVLLNQQKNLDYFFNKENGKEKMQTNNKRHKQKYYKHNEKEQFNPKKSPNRNTDQATFLRLKYF